MGFGKKPNPTEFDEIDKDHWIFQVGMIESKFVEVKLKSHWEIPLAIEKQERDVNDNELRILDPFEVK